MKPQSINYKISITMTQQANEKSLEQMLLAFPHDLSNDWQLFAFVSGNYRLQLSCPVGSKTYYGKDLRQVITDAYDEMTRARVHETEKTEKPNETHKQ